LIASGTSLSFYDMFLVNSTTSLQYLSLQACPSRRPNNTIPLPFPRLLALNLSGTHVDDGMGPILAGLTALEALSLGRTNITGQLFRFLPAVSLQHLELSDVTNIGGVLGGLLARLVNLRTLSLRETQLGDGDFDGISCLTQLHVLHIGDSGEPDEFPPGDATPRAVDACFSKLVLLEVLYVEHLVSFGNTAVAILGDSGTLKHLRVINTSVDAGLIRCLSGLGDTLRTVSVDTGIDQPPWDSAATRGWYMGLKKLVHIGFSFYKEPTGLVMPCGEHSPNLRVCTILAAEPGLCTTSEWSRLESFVDGDDVIADSCVFP
jgi:hypothetical protein